LLVRIRLGNLGPMDHHPIHIHGHAFEVTYTDGGPVPKAARWPETTTLVPVGAVRVIERTTATTTTITTTPRMLSSPPFGSRRRAFPRCHERLPGL
jgi:FtsP/CotA-like multicopper oxidase with cupredoxin domain